MNPETYASGNRLSEIEGNRVSFFKITGNVRKSRIPVWFVECEDLRRARRLAKRWAFKAKLGDPVLH